MQPQRQARGNEETDGEEGTADMATDGKATKRATAGEGGRLADGTAGDVAGREADAGASYEGLTVGNEVAGNDAVTGGTRGLTTGKAATDGDAVTGESRGTMVGLADGTPGCEGVCPEGEYDPRFDRKSDQFRKFGFIYKITCLVNGKVYIGQTTRSVRKRWRCHVDEPRYKSANRLNPIDSAIMKYGEDSFHVETLEKVLEEYLGIREQYWIRYYDCCTLDGYDKGYNASRGGDPNRRYVLDEQDIIRTYEMGCSIPWIMMVLQVRTIDPIRAILAKHGIPIRQHSIYNTSDLPECIVDAYYRTTGKTRGTGLSHHSKSSLHKCSPSPQHPSIPRVEDMPILVAQFDNDFHFVRVMRSYGEMVDWALASGASGNSHRQSLIAYIRQKMLLLQPYAARQMFQHYWVVLDSDDDIASPLILTKCEKALEEYANSRGAGGIRRFDENLNDIIVAILNSSACEVAKQLGITDRGLQKRLELRNIPHRTLDLFRYAVDNHLIDDPIGDAKDAIYGTFIETTSFEQTESICSCSKDDIYFACKYHGLSQSAVKSMRKKAIDPSEPS